MRPSGNEAHYTPRRLLAMDRDVCSYANALTSECSLLTALRDAAARAVATRDALASGDRDLAEHLLYDLECDLTGVIDGHS